MAPRASDMFIQAGLPIPIWNTRTTAHRDGKKADLLVGGMTHRVVAHLCTAAQDLTAAQIGPLVTAAVREHVRDRSLGRLDKTRMRVLGLALQYLTLMLPPHPAELLGSETPHRGRRTDLTWRTPRLGIWFDEIKTRRNPGEPLDDDTWAQIGRYLDDGTDQHGTAFRGVRIVTLGDVTNCRFIDTHGNVTPLRDTPFHRTSLLATSRPTDAPAAAHNTDRGALAWPA